MTSAPPRRSAASEAAHFLRSYFSDEPSYAIFFVTAVCNARCKHCFYWRQIADAKASRELKLPEIEKIAKSMPRLIYLSLGGGEPFARTDLAELVRTFYERSGILFCNIVTSGYFTDRVLAAVRSILAGCPGLRLKVQVSFDGFEEAHDRNRGVEGMYRRALETLKTLSRDVRAREASFSLDVATCLTRSNKAEAGALAAHLRSEAEFDNFSFLYPRGDAEAPVEKDVSPAEYEAAVRLLESASFADTHHPILGAVQRVARRGILEVLEQGTSPWDCLAGRKFVHVSERGVLQPCEMLGQLSPAVDPAMADLRDFDFDVRAALRAPRARELVAHIQDTRCRCSFECAAMNNVVFDKKNAAKVLATWLLRRGGER